MNFAPAIPLTGIAGYQFLQRTEETQRATFDRSPLLAREVEYFKENIANVLTAEELVADRQLFKVALGAFGLD
ncbi:MAG: flagellar protein, partial [Pseudomonadota bacterium]